jgi:hypothetical protein
MVPLHSLRLLRRRSNLLFQHIFGLPWGSFTNYFSPVRAHLFVAQKLHLERTGAYFLVDQISNR